MRLMIAAAIMVAASPFAFAQDLAGGAVKVSTTDKGEVLTNAEGMTLYIFDKDETGVSDWPPLMADDNAQPEGDFTIVTRTDGGKQWAYQGEPLYLWVKDAKPGDMTGDGVNDVWHTATM